VPELTLRVNGHAYAAEAPVTMSLAQLLRERLGLTGTKIACNEGHCGACTVQVEGVPTLSCITLAHNVRGEITTIEGLRDHPLIDAFVRADAVQCGFCTPGQVVSAAALVAANPSPTVNEIRHGMAGNICRCGTYPRIEEAILTWRD
jgi:aerobic-type carbon monoxide dehydrogenase small subunit (CoxS/CutS family)